MNASMFVVSRNNCHIWDAKNWMCDEQIADTWWIYSARDGRYSEVSFGKYTGTVDLEPAPFWQRLLGALSGHS